MEARNLKQVLGSFVFRILNLHSSPKLKKAKKIGSNQLKWISCQESGRLINFEPTNFEELENLIVGNQELLSELNFLNCLG
jgi:hypothetical protein